MTTAIFGHGRPWSEEDFLALGETPERIELFDGSLFVTPAPTPRHQHISGELLVALRPGAREAGLYVLEAETGTLHLYELAGDRYKEHSVTRPGKVLHLVEPVKATIAPEQLLSLR